METTPGKRLRFVRELLGFRDRQNDFAEALGMSQQALSNMERDKGKPSFDSLQKIVEKFPSVNPVYILTGTGEPIQPGKVASHRPGDTPLEQPSALVVSHSDATETERTAYWKQLAEERGRQLEQAEKREDRLWEQLKKSAGNPDTAEVLMARSGMRKVA